MSKTIAKKTVARNAACATLALVLLMGCVSSAYVAPSKTGWDLLPEILTWGR